MTYEVTQNVLKADVEKVSTKIDAPQQKINE